MTQSSHGWQRALLQLPTTDIGRWAVTGSTALALQGVAVDLGTWMSLPKSPLQVP
jgi:hypothetical protein